MSKKPEEAQDAAPPSGKRKKLLIIGLMVGLFLLVAAGAAAYLLLHKPADDEGEGIDEEVSTKSHGKKDKVEGPSVFMPLEAITVNLAPAETNPADVYLQTQITLEFNDAAIENSLRGRLPLVKHAYVMRLASKTADQLRSADGKKALADELKSDVNSILDSDKAAIKAGMKGRVREVLFTTFLLQ